MFCFGKFCGWPFCFWKFWPLNCFDEPCGGNCFEPPCPCGTNWNWLFDLNFCDWPLLSDLLLLNLNCWLFCWKFWNCWEFEFFDLPFWSLSFLFFLSLLSFLSLSSS